MTAAFHHAPGLPFRQAWLEETEPGFRGGAARFGWREDAFCVLARLEDDRVFTAATADHQRMWELGDVVEIFFKDQAADGYWEFHVTPQGHRLQLRFPADDTFDEVLAGRRAFEEGLVFEPMFEARVRVVPGGWEVFALVKMGPFFAGQGLRVSVSRYDYSDAAARPVLSSTSRHQKKNYHRLHEWSEVRLVD